MCSSSSRVSPATISGHSAGVMENGSGSLITGQLTPEGIDIASEERTDFMHNDELGDRPMD